MRSPLLCFLTIDSNLGVFVVKGPQRMKQVVNSVLFYGVALFFLRLEMVECQQFHEVQRDGTCRSHTFFVSVSFL